MHTRLISGLARLRICETAAIVERGCRSGRPARLGRLRLFAVALGVVLAVVLFGFGGVALAAPGDPPTNAGDRTSCSPACVIELARARMATDAYHDQGRASMDGFAPAGSCEASAEGAMGVHYINLARYAAHRLDTSVDAARPEFLLYFPAAGGSAGRLAGVEYGVPVFVNGVPYYGSEPPDPGSINPAPILFGHTFDGPMRGHIAAQPWHYDLHVWIWSANPAGTFAPWNAAWNCDGTYTPPVLQGIASGATTGGLTAPNAVTGGGFSLRSAHAGHNGTIRLRVEVRSAGRVTADARTTPRGARTTRGITYGRGSATASGPSTVALRIRPAAAAKRALRTHNHLNVLITVTFTPTGGTAISKHEAIDVRGKKGH